jgi:hypothetical protein
MVGAADDHGPQAAGQDPIERLSVIEKETERRLSCPAVISHSFSTAAEVPESTLGGFLITAQSLLAQNPDYVFNAPEDSSVVYASWFGRHVTDPPWYR